MRFTAVAVLLFSGSLMLGQQIKDPALHRTLHPAATSHAAATPARAGHKSRASNYAVISPKTNSAAAQLARIEQQSLRAQIHRTPEHQAAAQGTSAAPDKNKQIRIPRQRQPRTKAAR